MNLVQCLLSLILAGTPLPGRSVRAVTPTPQESAALARAQELLAGTEAGRPVSEFIAAKGIAVHFADMPANLHGGYGKDGGGRPMIMLARPSRRELLRDPEKAAFALAMTLAHEGTHARQDLEWGLVSSVEKETEAFLKEVEVQHALLRQGLEGPSFEAELRYRTLRHAGGVNGFVSQVRDAYASEEYLMTREAAPEQMAEWEADHALDGYRAIADLLKKAKDPTRKAALKKANAHWKEVLQSFRLTCRTWN